MVSCIVRGLWGVCLIVGVVAAARAQDRDIGFGADGARIRAAVVEARSADAATVVLVGGLDGDSTVADRVRGEVERYRSIPPAERSFRLLAVPLANPAQSRLEFPPTGPAYRERTESHVLWRWIGLQAPDLVVVVGVDEFGLTEALTRETVANVGRIPAERVAGSGPILDAVRDRDLPPSEAHHEIDRRRGRSPLEVAEELAAVYGQEFDQLTYIPGMSLIGRLRLGHVAEVAEIVSPWVDGERASTDGTPVSGNLAGYLVFAELAQATGDRRYQEMVTAAAAVAFDESGELRPSMPAASEMSDLVFMSIPILGKAARLTGDPRYCAMAARHLDVMQDLDLRADGLYRHSPTSSEVAWGRGNAFPALGLAITLSDCPENHPDFGRLLEAFQTHVTRLAQFQNADGLWHQVVDEPASYAEFTATAMIGVAMLRGVRAGWLDAATYQPRIDAAWDAVLARTGSDGQFVDVCESTNKQSTLEDYLYREAILGRDIRAGGMALLFATEMAGLF